MSNDLAESAAIESLWPDPVEVLNEHGRSPIVLLCEHASNYIPAEYSGLGLDASDLQRHIAWDIGAADVARQLSARLDAPAFLATYSRLLIDLNRPLSAAASMPRRSEATDIPGNFAIAPAERERRARRIFSPFHERIVAHLERREHAQRRSVLVAIHSFTPVYHGSPRPWHAGVLYDRAGALAQSIIAQLRLDPGLEVGANVPYAVSPEADYALLVHGDDRGIPAVLIEIRHDLIANPAGAEEWAGRLQTALLAATSSSSGVAGNGNRA